MPSKIIKGFEILWDAERAKEILLPPHEKIEDMNMKRNPYFARYGFKVPQYISEAYAKYNGIRSDKYIPISLYYFTLTPFLSDVDFCLAYQDKNMFGRLLPEVAQPVSLVKNSGGRYLDGEDREIDENEAVAICRDSDSDIVIKVSVEGGGGNGVQLLKREESSETAVRGLFSAYGQNFIVQKRLQQHEVLASYHASSLNTMRIYTFRHPVTHAYSVLGSALRFGGGGDFRDNACAGGGFCKIQEDGTVADSIHRYACYETVSRSRAGVGCNAPIPVFPDILRLCKRLHARIPYMGVVGWDIALDTNGVPTMVEFNMCPDCELIQIFNGPMFGDATDELMELVQGMTTTEVTAFRRSFPGRQNVQHHLYDIRRCHWF